MVNIKVAVRIRPMSNREESQREEVIVKNNEKCILVTNPKVSDSVGDSRQRVRRFAVDYCYDPAYPHLATQEAVYEELGTEILGNMFDGYNACVLAYGHSASGKTYTMMGDDQNPGLTPRLCSGLWREIDGRPHATYTLTVSFLEIYNERVQDLLIDEDASPSPGFSLRVREHPKLGPYVQGLSEHVVQGEEELLNLLARGNRKRSTAETESNVHSSRSHAVFTIKFKQLSDHTAKVSKVHLVDLAGSERASGVQNRERLKEGANINKSLVTLGNVISALAESCDSWEKCWQPFVPYRDSVLTWLLKDTLGGNSNTIMIATVSPASNCYNDTINTLRYAKRTKRIVNQPIVNEDPKIRTIRELRDEVSRLKTMLQSMQANQTEADGGCDSEGGSNSKWQAVRATQCAVALQTDEVLLADPTWATQTVQLSPSIMPTIPFVQQGSIQPQLEDVTRNITALDILPTFLESRENSRDTPTNPVPPHVSEINAENGTGVNGVIVEPERFSGLYRRTESVSREGLPRVSNRTLFKRKRTPFRRPCVNPALIMLHRSRPDLIKSISARPLEAPSTSSQSFVDASSQSVSENSLISTGSAESPTTRPRPQASLNLSRASSIGEASGSSTPTQSQKPIVRKREVKRAEIVASVTSRLYATKKRPDHRLEALQAAEKDDDDDDELEELKLCKRARMKLFDLSRKLAMAKKLKRTVDSDTQTEVLRSTLRVKEKCVATDQQGFRQVLNCATNTPIDVSVNESLEPPVVMNQVYLPNVGNFVLECGSNIRVAIPNTSTNDSASQTLPISIDQSTSPKKPKPTALDEFSDDSLDLETVNNGNKNISPTFYSCNNLASEVTQFSICERPQFYSNSAMNHCNSVANVKNANTQFGFLQKRSIDSLLGKPNNETVRVEKSLEPISRYTISGTNSLFEYDPNKGVPDMVVYSNSTDNSYEPGTCPLILYPQYNPELFNGLPIKSNETINSYSDEGLAPRKLVPLQNNEDNLSSNTSSASTTSVSASDSSSDDFVYIQSNSNSNNAKPSHDLYTISENSEPSCSNLSTPLNSTSPRFETPGDIEAEHNQTKAVMESEPCGNGNEDESSSKECNKKINWSEMQCQSNRRFINFNFKPALFNTPKIKNQSSEANFVSEDSITFVFLGPKQQSTSVLLELIKRSLVNESDSTGDRKDSHHSRTKGVQCNSKLMRSVSVDTAMIALSRFARHQRPSTDITRTSSLNTIVSEELQVILDQGKLHSQDNETQCDITNQGKDGSQEMLDEHFEKLSNQMHCQCYVNKTKTPNITTNDKETVTDPEKREGVTQTDTLEDLFDAQDPELPRSIGIENNISINEDIDSKEKKLKELKQLVLGTQRDLFPEYLKSAENTGKPKKSGKSVSWSDLGEQTKAESAELSKEASISHSTPQSQKLKFFKSNEQYLNQTRSPCSDQQQNIQAISSFINEATILLRNLSQSGSQISSDSESEIDKFSSSSLLKRRARILPRMKICGTQSETTNLTETSVQTDVEKTDRLVQTGGFTSSLVSSFARRGANKDFISEDSSNMTWPRRRTCGKPPTGLRQSRSSIKGHTGSISSPNGSINTTLTVPDQPLNIRNSPRQTPSVKNDTQVEELDWQIEESCKRLELAINRDHARQSSLTHDYGIGYNNINNNEEFQEWMRNSTPDYNSIESVTTIEYLNTQQKARANRKQMPNYTRRTSLDSEESSARVSDSMLSRISPTIRWPLRDNGLSCSPTRPNTIEYEFRSKSKSNGSTTSSPSINLSLGGRDYGQKISINSNVRFQDYTSRQIRNNYALEPNLITDRNKLDRESSKEKDSLTVSDHDDRSDIETAQGQSMQYNSKHDCMTSPSYKRKMCRCACHNANYSFSELISGASLCHSCCVPCIGDQVRPYHSEPALCLLNTDRKTSRGPKCSPSAHLRYLIELRRTIVAEHNQKPNGYRIS